MDTERHDDQHNKALYDAVDHMENGWAYYSLYSQDRAYQVQILVLKDGKLCEPVRFEVKDNMYPYPDALAGDYPRDFVPEELEARAATLMAELKATAPRQRTTLSRDQPEKSVSRTWRTNSREVSKGRKL